MHEFSITKSMLGLVLQQAEKAGAREVEKINLVIGEMTGVVDENVKFYFNLLSKGTMAERASLSLKMVPMTVQCRGCDKSFPLEESGWTCPYCGNSGVKIISGQELIVESIDIN